VTSWGGTSKAQQDCLPYVDLSISGLWCNSDSGPGANWLLRDSAYFFTVMPPNSPTCSSVNDANIRWCGGGGYVTASSFHDGGTMFDKHWVQRVAYAFATALFIRFPQVSQGQANAAVTSTVMRALGPRDPRATRNMAVALGALAADACADEVAQAHHLAADAFDARARALGLPVRLSQLPVQVPRESLPLIVQDSLKNFNADPKREFQREVDLLCEVIDAAW
jgi:hypothetical protein